MITADEFAQGYAERGGVTLEWLKSRGREVMPCHCDWDECEGWQMGYITDPDDPYAQKRQES